MRAPSTSPPKLTAATANTPPGQTAAATTTSVLPTTPTLPRHRPCPRDRKRTTPPTPVTGSSGTDSSTQTVPSRQQAAETPTGCWSACPAALGRPKPKPSHLPNPNVNQPDHPTDTPRIRTPVHKHPKGQRSIRAARGRDSLHAPRHHRNPCAVHRRTPHSSQSQPISPSVGTPRYGVPSKPAYTTEHRRRPQRSGPRRLDRSRQSSTPRGTQQ